MKKKLATILIVLSCFVFNNSASGAVINAPDVSGYKTFQDTNTGWVWMDLDNFLNKTPNYMISAASSAGFTFATRSDLEILLNSLPLDNEQWSSYASVMGESTVPGRDIMWAAYDSGQPNHVGAAWAFSSDTNWTFSDVGANYDRVPGLQGDMNIWAYQTPAPVPEPSSIILGLLGLSGVIGLRKKK